MCYASTSFIFYFLMGSLHEKKKKILENIVKINYNLPDGKNKQIVTGNYFTMLKVMVGTQYFGVSAMDTEHVR